MTRASAAWQQHLKQLIKHGRQISPRGKPTLELPSHQLLMDMQRPVVLFPERKLSYQYLAAEAAWILSGDNRTETIVPWNKNLIQFSDDEETFFGAYGPRIVSQLPYIVRKLREDSSTRQAVLTIWREDPPASKDIPCTVAMVFHLREQLLHLHVFMRSSDAWLGVPYDVFTFAMVAHRVCAELNEDTAHTPVAAPGHLFLTMASAHLYLENAASAEQIIESTVPRLEAATPKLLWNDVRGLLDTLQALRDTKPGDPLRWWERGAA